jgi:ribosome-associated protein
MAKSPRPRTTRATPRLPAQLSKAIDAAGGKKATAITVLDLRKTGAFTDYFLICTGANPRQVHAIADGIEEALKAIKVRPTHVEGYARAEWVLLDYFDFIVHVFSPSARQFYGLERLWGEATRIDIEDEPAPKQARG